MNRLYDLAMRVPIAGLTLYFLLREVDALRAEVGRHPVLEFEPQPLLRIAAHVAVIEFLLLLAVFFLVRRPPVRKLAAWTPKVTALAGYALTLTLLLLPRAPREVWFDGASTLLILGGNVLCVLALLSLGRSLSLMPEARRLVTDGLYRRIRHPLYLAEEIAVIGVFLQYRSWTALAILLVHLALQLRRIAWEERVLGEAFPDYATYARATHRLIPGVY